MALDSLDSHLFGGACSLSLGYTAKLRGFVVVAVTDACIRLRLGLRILYGGAGVSCRGDVP